MSMSQGRPALPSPGGRPVTGQDATTVAVERVLAELWRGVQPAAAASGPAADAVAADPVQALARQFGERAMDCVSATIQGDRAALVRGSAALFEQLFGLWAGIGLDPREVWIELHKREQLGTLLMQLNQAQNQLPRRVLKPWRVDSTKLP